MMRKERTNQQQQQEVIKMMIDIDDDDDDDVVDNNSHNNINGNNNIADISTTKPMASSGGSGDGGWFCCNTTTNSALQQHSFPVWTDSSFSSSVNGGGGGGGNWFAKLGLNPPQKPLNRKQQQQPIDPIIQKILTERWNQLSIDERIKIRNDIDCTTTIDDYNNKNNPPSLSSSSSTTSSSNNDNDNDDNEEEEYILDCLNELENEINNRSGISKSAYNLAYSINKEYVTNKKFRLKFLYADEFNIKDTATRILYHFTSKFELFGASKIVEDILYDDLSYDDQQSLRTGSHQLIGQDANGRKLCVASSKLVVDAPWDVLLRAQWYQFMKVIDNDITVQKNGIVIITFWDLKMKFHPKIMQIMTNALPYRPIAIHYCYINCKMPKQMQSLFRNRRKQWQIRHCFHLLDNVISCLYTLQSYGINCDSVPVLDDGISLDDTLFLKNLDEQILLEREELSINRSIKNHATNNKNINTSTSSKTTTTTTTTTTTPNDSSTNTATTTDINDTTTSTTTTTAATTNSSSSDDDNNNNNNNNNVVTTKTKTKTKTTNNNTATTTTNTTTVSSKMCVTPTRIDVLLGRGMKYPGNFALDKVITDIFPTYQKVSTKFEKSCIILSTIKQIEDYGGRFLIIDKNTRQICIADPKFVRSCISSRFQAKTKKFNSINNKKGS